MKILVADDERDIADAIGIILQYSGYKSDIAYDGQRAYELTRQHSYDGMILDIMMPKMDGIQLLSKLREEGDVTPILLLTAKSQVEDRITGLNEDTLFCGDLTIPYSWIIYHCFYVKIMLKYNLGQPSRSDFVQLLLCKRTPN